MASMRLRASASRSAASSSRVRAARPNSTTLRPCGLQAELVQQGAVVRAGVCGIGLQAGADLRPVRARPARLRAASGVPLKDLSSSVLYRMDWPVLAQSARNGSSPLSVNGCLKRALKTSAGMVAQSAPAMAAAADVGRVAQARRPGSRCRSRSCRRWRGSRSSRLDAVGAVVVQPADEGRDEGGAGLGGQQGLGGREAQGDVGLDALVGEGRAWRVRPSRVSGTFTTTLGAMAASLSPSLTMVSKSVATTSARDRAPRRGRKSRR